MADNEGKSQVSSLKRSRQVIDGTDETVTPDNLYHEGVNVISNGPKKYKNGTESGSSVGNFHYINGGTAPSSGYDFTGSQDGNDSEAENTLDLQEGDADCVAGDQAYQKSFSNGNDWGLLNGEGSNIKEQIEVNGTNEKDDDNLSEISDLSDISTEGWRPIAGPMCWVQRQMMMGMNPRHVLCQIISRDAPIPEDLDDLTLWKLIINILSEPPRRDKLTNINTLENVVELIKNSKKIMVLTGAGVSVSCGIPDFRSKDGIYARLSVEYPDLPDPQAMFDIQYFRRNQGPFFKFAKEIYPGLFEPSTGHKFIKLLEDHNKLLRNYTQNIDTLEQIAGIRNVIQCHGSFAKATCMVCKRQVEASAIREDIMNQIIPRCQHCPPEEPLAIMKPDIVFFGESLPTEFHRQMEIDKDECDLLIVMGSSLKVRPVALIPNSLPAEIPQVLINREPLRHLNFDVELLGDCDVIINELCHRLGEEWTSICTMKGPLQQVMKDELPTPPVSVRHRPDGMLTPPPSGAQTPQSVMSAQPASEENSRMSFQVATDEDSRMSMPQDEEGTHEPEENTIETESQCTHPCANTSESTAIDSILSESEHDRDSLSQPTNDSPSEQHGSTVRSDNSLDKSTVNSETGPDPLPQDTSKSEPRPDEEMEVSSELQELRACWQPRTINLGSSIQEGTFLFLPPHRYVFRGAEYYETESEDEDGVSDDESSDSGSRSDSDSDSILDSIDYGQKGSKGLCGEKDNGKMCDDAATTDQNNQEECKEEN